MCPNGLQQWSAQNALVDGDALHCHKRSLSASKPLQGSSPFRSGMTCRSDANTIRFVKVQILVTKHTFVPKMVPQTPSGRNITLDLV